MMAVSISRWRFALLASRMSFWVRRWWAITRVSCSRAPAVIALSEWTLVWHVVRAMARPRVVGRGCGDDFEESGDVEGFGEVFVCSEALDAF